MLALASIANPDHAYNILYLICNIPGRTHRAITDAQGRHPPFLWALHAEDHVNITWPEVSLSAPGHQYFTGPHARTKLAGPLTGVIEHTKVSSTRLTWALQHDWPRSKLCPDEYNVNVGNCCTWHAGMPAAVDQAMQEADASTDVQGTLAALSISGR